MTSSRAPSAVTAALVCGAAAIGFACLRFARSVIVRMLGEAGLEDVALPRLSSFALGVSHPATLTALVVACVAAVVASEIAVTKRDARLLVQLVVLLLLVLLLSVVLAGLFMPFHVPVVRIP